MEQLACVRFFIESFDYGLVTYREQEAYLHKDVCQNLALKWGDWVICEIGLLSVRRPDKNRVTKIRRLSEDYEFFKENLIKFSIKERVGINQKISFFLKNLVKEYFALFNCLQAIDEQTESYINSFKLEKFVETISGKIHTGGYQRPGEDDSFSAWIKINSNKTDDPYISTRMPSYSEETYSDSGFYPVRLMKKDYETGYRQRDETRLPELIELFKNEYINAYNANAHKACIIEQRIMVAMATIEQELVKFGKADIACIKFLIQPLNYTFL